MVVGNCIASRLAVLASVLRLMVSIIRPRGGRKASGLASAELAVTPALSEMPVLLRKGGERRPGGGLLSLFGLRGLCPLILSQHLTKLLL